MLKLFQLQYRHLLYKTLVTFILVLIATAGAGAQNVIKPGYDTYFKGLKLYDQGLFGNAAKLFDQFVQAHPNDRLTETAYYYEVKSKARIDSANTDLYFERYLKRYPRGSKSVDVLVDLGNRADRDGHYDRAISYYKRALKRNPDSDLSSKILFWMAESSTSMGDNNQARHFYMTLADSFPSSQWAPKALFNRGRLYLDENNYKSATDAFEILKNKYPNDAMTRRVGTALGESYFRQKRYDEAIDALNNAMPYLDEEGKSKAVYLIAESYNYLNQFQNASKYYLRFINMNKGSDKVRLAYYGLGWVYNKQKIYHWAADAFEKAAKGNDDLARKALYYKAVNEKLGGRYEDALKTFRDFGNKYKKGTWVQEAYYEWAVTAFETGRYTETIEVCEDLVRSNMKLDHPGKVFSLLGQGYFANNEYTRAIEAFNEAAKSVDVNPEVQWEARFQKAWVLYRNQAYKQAQPLFEDVYKHNTKSDLAGEALFWDADCYYHMQQYGTAAKLFRNYLNQFPNGKFNGAARYSIGWADFERGDYEAAIDPFKAFLKNYKPPPVALFPYDEDTRLRIGDSYYALKQYDQAIQYYQQAVNSKEGGDYALYQIANSYYRSNQSYQAVSTLRELMNKFPNSSLKAQAQYNIAYIYFLSNNYEQAISEFKRTIRMFPGSQWAARSQYNIGDAYYNASRFDSAITAYRQVLNKYSKSNYVLDAINGIQYAMTGAGKTDSTSSVLESYLAQHPQSNVADRLRFKQAENLLQTGDYKSAIKSLKEYIRITNNEQQIPDAYFDLANAYEQTHQTAQAQQAYLTIVNQYGKSDRAGSALANLGRISGDQGNYNQALEYYRRLSGKREYRTEAFNGMADAFLNIGQIDSAQDYYEKSLNLQSNNDASKLGLGKVAFARKNYDKALGLLQPIAHNNTTAVGAQAQYMIGQVYQDQGNYNQALQEYGKVKVLYEAYDSWVAKALLNSSECYESMGKTGDAHNTLQQIVKNYPGTVAAQQAARKLNSK